MNIQNAMAEKPIEFWTLIVSGIDVIISGIAVIVYSWQARIAQNALNTACKTLKCTQDSARIQLSPYLGLYDCVFLENTVIRTIWTNSGQTPANIVLKFVSVNEDILSFDEIPTIINPGNNPYSIDFLIRNGLDLPRDLLGGIIYHDRFGDEYTYRFHRVYDDTIKRFVLGEGGESIANPDETRVLLETLKNTLSLLEMPTKKTL